MMTAPHLHGALQGLHAVSKGFYRRLSVHSNIFIPVLLGLSVALWINPRSYFIFGQDAYPFANPFGFNTNPLLQYSYLFNWFFPIPANQASFLFFSFVSAIQDLFPSAVLAQQLFLGCLVALASFGILYLMRVIYSSLTGGSNRPPTWTLLLVASLYVLNPFTLSVVWWHLEGWTFFYVFLPFILGLVLEYALLRKPNLLNAFGVLSLGLFLGPGVVGAFLVPIAYVLLFGSVLIALKIWLKGDGIRKLAGRLVVIWSVYLVITLYMVIPYELIPNAAFSSTNYVTATNLVTSFISISMGATLPNVLSFTGTNWFLLNPLESPFPWLSLVPLLSALALLLLVVSAIPLVRAGPHRRLELMLLSFIVVPVIWATGANFPLQSVKFYLLRLGGPFLALVEGYYFAAELYVVALITLAFICLSTAWRWVFAVTQANSSYTHSQETAGGETKCVPGSHGVGFDSVSTSRVAKRVFQIIGVTLVISIVVTASAFAYPFLTGQVYKSVGPNSGAVPLPDSFSELQNFFKKNYSGPYYYTILLPLSNIAALPLNVSGSKLLDTSGLIAQYIPYPTIWINNSILEPALDLMFSNSAPFTNYTMVFSALHIRYAIFNPYADVSSPFVREASNGHPINWSRVEASLAQTMPMTSVGPFAVFSNLGALPIATLATGISTYVDANLTRYLTTLSGIRGAPNTVAGQLKTAVWSPDQVSGVPTVRTTSAPVGIESNLTIPVPSTPYLVSTSGYVVTPQNMSRAGIVGVSYTPRTRSLNLAPPPICTLNIGSCNFTTTFESKNGTYYNPLNMTSEALFPTAESNGSLMLGAIDVIALGTHNWLTVELVNQSVRLEAQIYASTGTDVLSMSAMNSTGVPYAWNNVVISSPTILGAANFSIEVESSEVIANFTFFAKGPNSTINRLFFQPADIYLNGGFDASASPHSTVTIGAHSIRLTVTNAAIKMQSWGEYQPTHLSRILELPAVTQAQSLIHSTISSTVEGNILMSASQNFTHIVKYVILAYPESSLWVATTSSGCSLKPVTGFPLANVYMVGLCRASGSQFSVTLTFNVSLDVGLFVAVGLFVGASVTFLAGTTFRRLKYAHSHSG